MNSTAVLGCLWGDEGKAKIVDALALQADAVIRYQGGSNAGHTICKGKQKVILHIVPSGILHKNIRCVIAAGVVVDPFQLREEMEELIQNGVSFNDRFFIDPRAGVVLPVHKTLDARSEDLRNDTKIGTTKRGIGPAYADRAARTSLQLGDLLQPEKLKSKLEALHESHQIPLSSDDLTTLCDRLKDTGMYLQPFFRQVPYLLDEWYESGSRLLFEGAQGALLDVFFGSYPFVTSSSTIAGGIAAYSGFSPRRIGRIIGVYKSYISRVGEGPFPTMQDNPTGDWIRERGHEYGSTTRRPRRCGWFDTVAGRYTAMINGISEIALTLLDVLTGLDTIKICTSYEIDGTKTREFPWSADLLAQAQPQYIELPGWKEDIAQIRNFGDLPAAAKAYVQTIENELHVPVKIISVGPDRDQTIQR